MSGMKSSAQGSAVLTCTDLAHGQMKRDTSEPLTQLDILTNIEFYLSNKLKEFCGKDGREKDTNESAIIFHKLGRLYRDKSVADASNQKRHLIKSAVLFNAALVRKPNNAQVIHDDLNDLCMHVCRLAGVTKENAKLKKETSTASRKVKRMRRRIKGELSLVKILSRETLQHGKIKSKFAVSVEELQRKAYKAYCKLMKKLTNICINLKVSAPCKYAIIGMGSLAKKEITPYSDFEHAIVLEEGVQQNTNYEEILEYFRWFSVILHLVVVNLGETIIPSICLPFINNPRKKSFNWFFDAKTKRGVSFDGMMPQACKFPLGKEKTKDIPWKIELIKPISEMLKHLEKDADVQRNFHLKEMLQKTCFVAGDQEIYEEFQRGVACHRTDLATWQKLVSKDIEKFNPFETLRDLLSTPKWNLKRVVYRSLGLFVEALGNMCKLEGNSSFEIIRELVQADVIDNDFGEDLLFSAAAACYLRLVMYAQKDSQSDYLVSPANTEDYEKIFDKWIGIKPSVFFFKVVLKLHRFTAFRADIIKYYEYVKLSDLHYHLHSCCLLRQFKDAAVDSETLLHNPTSNIFDVVFASLTLGQCGSDAYRAEDYLKAKEYITEIIKRWENWQEDNNPDNPKVCGKIELPTAPTGGMYVKTQHVRMYKQTVAHTFNLFGRCLFHENLFEEALKKYENAVDIAKEVTEQETTDPKIARFLVDMGKCHLLCQRTNEAFKCFTDAINIWKNNGDQGFAANIDNCNRLMKYCENTPDNVFEISSEFCHKHPNYDTPTATSNTFTLFRCSARLYYHKRSSKKGGKRTSWNLFRHRSSETHD